MKVGTFLFAESVKAVGDGRYLGINIYSGNVVFENVESAKLSSASILLCIYDVSRSSYELSFRLVNKTEKKAVTFGGEPFSVENDKTAVTFDVQIDEMSFPAPGIHQLQVLVDGEQVGELEFKVDITGYQAPAKKPARKKRSTKPKPDAANNDESTSSVD